MISWTSSKVRLMSFGASSFGQNIFIQIAKTFHNSFSGGKYPGWILVMKVLCLDLVQIYDVHSRLMTEEVFEVFAGWWKNNLRVEFEIMNNVVFSLSGILFLFFEHQLVLQIKTKYFVMLLILLGRLMYIPCELWGLVLCTRGRCPHTDRCSGTRC